MKFIHDWGAVLLAEIQCPKSIGSRSLTYGPYGSLTKFVTENGIKIGRSHLDRACYTSQISQVYKNEFQTDRSKKVELGPKNDFSAHRMGSKKLIVQLNSFSVPKESWLPGQ